MSENHSAAQFPTTHWGRVLAAGGGDPALAQQSLDELCGDYWYPLYAFVRRKGHDPQTAQDLVQELFTELIERDDLRTMNPEHGRFRSFLMACCTHLLAKHHAREHAQKRGGGHLINSVDAQRAESRYSDEPVDDVTPERFFEHQWALMVIDQVFKVLESEMTRTGKQALYQRLKGSLLGQDGGATYRDIAHDLKMTEGAVKMAASRFRDRYRAILRTQVARTVANPAEVEDELRYLIAALSE